MKHLLDTCVVVRFLMGDENYFPARSAKILQDEKNECFVSTISIWEIVIKHAIGKLALSEPPGEWLMDAIRQMGWIPMPVQAHHALRVARLQDFHQDAFDRMILAQASCEGLAILTPDPIFKKYRGVTVLWK